MIKDLKPTSCCFFLEESPPIHENIFRGRICLANALPENGFSHFQTFLKNSPCLLQRINKIKKMLPY